MFVGANKLEIDLVFGPARAHLGPVFGFKPSLVIYLRKYGMCIAPEGRSRIGIDLHIGVSSGTEHDSFAVGFFGADQAQCQKQETRDTQMHAPFQGIWYTVLISDSGAHRDMEQARRVLVV